MGLSLGLVIAARRPSVQQWLLIIFSYLFYSSSGLVGILVITLTSIVDYNVGLRIGNSTSTGTRSRWLWASLSVNIGMLVFFKYSIFLAETVAAVLSPLGVRVSAPDNLLLLPIGLSYFTFAGLSYVLDIYYERIEPSRRFSEYICYLLYFPKLLAGPIVRATELLPQIKLGFRVTAEDFQTGCAYVLVGAVKKLVIADRLASHVSMIFVAPGQYDAFTLLQGVVGYSVQIYADFSGYSDMAIGCARMMGIRFPQNFLMPYSSVNITEFWRRWHVTLSGWFRDYVFIPLEVGSRGTRNASLRMSRNLIITMLLCGLWHGANWNFVLWGGLHGVALALHQVYGRVSLRRMHQETRSPLHLGTLASRALTLSVVMLGWVLFGTGNLTLAFEYIWRMLSWSSTGIALGSSYIVPLTGLVFLAHLFIDKDRNLIEELPTLSTPIQVLAYSTLLLALTSLVPSDVVPFVYLQF